MMDTGGEILRKNVCLKNVAVLFSFIVTLKISLFLKERAHYGF